MSDTRTEKLINEYLGKKFMTKDGLEEIEIIAVARTAMSTFVLIRPES